MAWLTDQCLAGMGLGGQIGLLVAAVVSVIVFCSRLPDEGTDFAETIENYAFTDDVIDVYGTALSMLGDYQLFFIVWGAYAPAVAEKQSSGHQSARQSQANGLALVAPFALWFFCFAVPLLQKMGKWCSKEWFENELRKEQEYDSEKPICCLCEMIFLGQCRSKNNLFHPIVGAGLAFYFEGGLFGLVSFITLCVNRDFATGLAFAANIVGAVALYLKWMYLQQYKESLDSGWVKSGRAIASESKTAGADMARTAKAQKLAEKAEEIANPVAERMTRSDSAVDGVTIEL
eukprot:g4012.t1